MSLSKGWSWVFLAMLAGGFALFALWPNLSGGGDAPGDRPSGSTGVPRVAEGKVLFGQHCAVCHAPGARGQHPALPMGGMSDSGTYIAPALNGTGHAWHHSPGALFRVIKTGSPAADSPMRAFQDRLNDADIRAVLDYIFSLWPAPLRARYEEMMKGR